MTPEQYAELLDLRRIAELEEKLKPPPEAPTVGSGLKAAGSGVAEGLIAPTAGMLGDVAGLGRVARSAVTPEGLKPVQAKIDQYNPVMAAINALPSTKNIMETAGIDYEPRDSRESFIQRGVSGMTSGIATPMKALSWAARGLTGLLSGGAAEATKQAGMGPIAEVGASMVPWLGVGGAAARTPNAVKAAQGAVKSVGEESMREAGRRVAKSRQTLGEEFLLSQGFDEPNALTGLTHAIAAEPQGRQMGEIVGKQGRTAKDLMTSLIDSMSKRSMGPEGATETQRAGRRAYADASTSVPQGPVDELRSLFGPPTIKKMGKPPVSYSMPQPKDDFTRMTRGLDKNTPEGISRVAQELGAVDREAFPSIVKSQFQDAAEESMKSANWLKTMSDKVFGHEQLPSREAFVAKMRGIAESQGKKPKAAERYVKQATDLFEAIETASRDRTLMGKINEIGFLQESGRNVVSEGMRSANLIAPLWRTGSAFERAVSRETLKTLSNALSKPGGVDLLIDIGKHGKLDHAARQLIMALVASRGGAGTAGQ